ncbi:hypothetical protein ACVJF2_005258 [Bradyrhizobium sp. USDA 4519]
MVLVEDLARLRDVDRLLLRNAPGQIDQPVEIAAHHAGFGRCLRHPLVAAQFLLRLAFGLRRHLGLDDRLGQLGDFRGLAVTFAELALDRRHLLAQDRLALPLVEHGLGLLPDLLAQPQHLDTFGEVTRHLVHPCHEIDGFQDVLFLRRLDVHVGRRKVGKGCRRGGALQCCDQLLRHLRQQLRGLQRLALQIEEARLDLGRGGGRLGNLQHAGREERRARQIVEHAHALHALADQMVAVVRTGDVAHDVGCGADAVKPVGAGIVGLGIALQQDADRPLLAHRLLGRGNRGRPGDRDRNDDIRKQHGVAHRDDDQRVARDRRRS